MNQRLAHMGCSLLAMVILGACSGSGANVAPAALLAQPQSVVRERSTDSVAIDAGGNASANWVADTGYSMVGRFGTMGVREAIDTSQVTKPAPQAVYRTQRYGTQLTYRLKKLSPGTKYLVRLHFVESYFHTAGKRVFDATINGERDLHDYDIFKAAGGKNIAVVPQFSSTADAAGKITIELAASVNNASIAGIELGPAAADAPTPAPSQSPSSYAGANLPPPGWQFPYEPNVFTIPACASDPCSPALDASSTSEISAVMNHGALDLGDIYEGYPGDNDFPVYYASPSDPSYTVTCDRGGCGTGTIVANIPDGAYASAGSDHHLVVVNLSTGVETDFWEFNDARTGVGTVKPVHGGGALSSGSGGVCPLTSFAGNRNACANSATGSGLPLQPQILDPREIAAGAIDHTLYVALGCGRGAFTFPAFHSDGTCPAGPLYGQRIWLDLSDARIDALGDPPWATTLLHAMHRYGWIVSDNNGAKAGMAFANLAPQTFTSWGKPNPWTAFFSAAGGGTFVSLPTAGISQTNVHVLAPCVNTQSC